MTISRLRAILIASAAAVVGMLLGVLVTSVGTGSVPRGAALPVEVPKVQSLDAVFPATIRDRTMVPQEQIAASGGSLLDHIADALYPHWPAVAGFIPAVGAEYERPQPNTGGIAALKIVWMRDPTGTAPLEPMTEEQLAAARTWWLDSAPSAGYKYMESNGSAWSCSIGPSPVLAHYDPAVFDAPPDTNFSICSWVLPGMGAMFIQDLDVTTIDEAMHNTAELVNRLLVRTPADPTPQPTT